MVYPDRHRAVARLSVLGSRRQRVHRHTEWLRPDHVRPRSRIRHARQSTQQMEDGFEIGPQTPLAGEVAGLICELTGMERVTFCNTGSEAVMAAIRVARTVTGRNTVRVLRRRLPRHLRRGPRQGDPQRRGAAFGADRARHPAQKVGPTSPSSTTAHPNRSSTSARMLSELAAVLVEPVQSRHPALQPVEFLREIREDHRGCRHGASSSTRSSRDSAFIPAVRRRSSVSVPIWRPTAR